MLLAAVHQRLDWFATLNNSIKVLIQAHPKYKTLVYDALTQNVPQANLEINLI